MAKGDTIDELYIGLGLDVSELQLGFETAGKTVNQTIARLNSENKQIKLKTDIDLTKLEGAGKAVDVLKVKECGLTQQIEIQKQKLDILAKTYEAAHKADKAKGLNEDSNLTRGAYTNYLRQQQAVEKLNASLRKLQAEQQKVSKAGNGLSKIGVASQVAKRGVDGVANSYGLLSKKAAAAMAVATTGAGLFNITNSAMQAGESLYKLQNRLHLTTAEAGQLSRLFSISGVNIQGIIPYFSQLDKQVLSGGKNMNAMQTALMEFGVSLKDSSGHLLPLNQQLAQLAKGYENAAQAGKLEEFQAQVLGRRGAELIPLLEDYNTNMRIASSIKTTGLLDPKQAHELSIEWRAMKAEAGQLENAFGAALMPIAKEVMPEVTEAMKELIGEISSNKGEVKETIENWGKALKTFGELAAGAADKLGWLFGKVSEGSDKFKWMKENHPYVTAGSYALGGPLLGLSGAGLLYTKEYGAYLQQQKTYKDIMNGTDNSSLGKVFNNALNKGSEPFNINDVNRWGHLFGQTTNFVQQACDRVMPSLKNIGKAEKENTQAAKENATAQSEAAKAMKWRASAAGQLSEAIYSLTHNDVDNAIHAMYVKAEQARANGVSEDLILKFVNAQSGKIAQDKFRNVTAPMAEAFRNDLQNQLAAIDLQAMDFVQKGASRSQANAWANARKSQIRSDWDRQVADQIDSIWKTQYQNQLERIDRERQAWIRKGLDEVKAAQWAEEKKREIQQNAAKEMFTQQKEYLKLYRDAIASGRGQAGAVEDIKAAMRKKAGISDTDFTSPSEIAGFSRAMKEAQDNLVPILSDATYRGVKAAMVEVIRGEKSGYEFAGDNPLVSKGKEQQDNGAWQSYKSWSEEQAKSIMEQNGYQLEQSSELLAKATDAISSTARNIQSFDSSPRSVRQFDYDNSKRQIDLNVNVNGFTDGALKDQFVEAGAKVVANALASADMGSSLSY